MTPAPLLGLGLALTAAAGMIDAVGFVELGGYYTSFMSGNTTQLGAAIADPGVVLLPLGLVAMFFLGSFGGTLVAGHGNWHGTLRVLGLVLATLTLSLALTVLGIPPQLSMLPLAFAAGAQNAVLVQRGSVRVGATFVTGTLFAAGQDLARGLRGDVPVMRWLQHVLVWAALLLGAAMGALVYVWWHIWALALPAAIYALMFAGFALRRSNS
ncbi:YoaK family protein [Devosia sp.]|uniref:YoaK family protein n=1 Tax=Devosia sp. TaxID=1871048 RepID=UPI003A9120BB